MGGVRDWIETLSGEERRLRREGNRHWFYDRPWDPLVSHGHEPRSFLLALILQSQFKRGHQGEGPCFQKLSSFGHVVTRQAPRGCPRNISD